LSQVSDSKTASRSSKCRKTTPPDRAASPKIPHSSVELPVHQIGDDCFEVRLLNFGFAVNAPKLSEAINYKVDGLVRTVGHDIWRPTGAGHTHLLRNKRN
jgi:hypothetical protein